MSLSVLSAGWAPSCGAEPGRFFGFTRVKTMACPYTKNGIASQTDVCHYLPTEEEIAERAAEVRAGWDAETERKRVAYSGRIAAMFYALGVNVCAIRDRGDEEDDEEV